MTILDNKENNILDCFYDVVERNSNKISLICGDQSITYKELDEISNSLARYLQKKGIKPGSIVGVSLPNHSYLVISLLAILKVGGVYLPLEPQDPQERLHLLIEDTKTELVITTTLFRDHFKGKVHAIFLDEVWNDVKCMNGAKIEQTIALDQPAYIFYTSGSTGRPKGIVVSHQSLPHIVRSHHALYPPERKTLISGTIGFDMSLLLILPNLMTGQILYMSNMNYHFDVEEFISLILRHQIELIACVPAFYNMILQKKVHLPSLKVVTLAGENLPPSLPPMHAIFAPNAILYNEYGPTEYAIGTSVAKIYDPVTKKIDLITIGPPLEGTSVYILNDSMELLPDGERGEICIAGLGLALGYLGRDDLTKEKFVFIELPTHEKIRIYRSGDFGRFLPSGDIEFLGRMDFQVKIRGNRVELEEIEQAIAAIEGVKEAVVIPQDMGQSKRLVGYFTSTLPGMEQKVRAVLAETHPHYMVPALLICVDRFDLTPNGKIDRKALVLPPIDTMEEVIEEEDSSLQGKLLYLWKKVLQNKEITIYDRFFDLGGDSLQIVRLQMMIEETLGIKLGITDLFQYPTVDLLVNYLEEKNKTLVSRNSFKEMSNDSTIAIIGMTGRFPGADNLEKFWSNLCHGVESISKLTTEQLKSAGVDDALMAASNYVRAKGVLANPELFDAEFFEINPKEAEYSDPQHRLFLECVWEALENAGYDPSNYDGAMGVYAGSASSSYLQHYLLPNKRLVNSIGDYLLQIANEKDFLTTKVSYKLNLKGPSVVVQSACSTSLVAVCLACDHLLSHQCDIAIAGGATIYLPQGGYLYQEGMIVSPDGRCRPFDAEAKGTVPGNGVGVVILKRYQEALKDGDHIYALIKGYGVSNDGSQKVGYSAPGIDGQSQAICRAIAMSGVDPETIGYLEAHGTGTGLGDPIEVKALKIAFEQYTQSKGYCALGSVKSNIGHLFETAGVASLIKTALCVYYGKMPATLHVDNKNPNIEFDDSPFYLNTSLRDWPSNQSIRRAGLSSFGIGGTNAHMIVEQPPMRQKAAPVLGLQLLVISGKTPSALKNIACQLANHFEMHPDLSLADVAYVLAVGRKPQMYRQYVVCSNLEEASKALFHLTNEAVPPVAKQHAKKQQQEVYKDDFKHLNNIGKLWSSGEPINWKLFYEGMPLKRIPLPTYPFEKKRYWIDLVQDKNQDSIEIQKEPLSEIEQGLVMIWKDLLGVESIEKEDNFFELGGDSVLAIQVSVALQSQFGVTLRPQLLMEYPTIASLAAFIKERTEASNHPALVKLRNGKLGNPLFLIHPIGGNLFSYGAMVKELNYPFSLYGLQSLSNGPDTIEKMASFYIEAIRTVQPKGPYRLIGNSFGGLVAYEMACQLTNMGQGVDLLTMIDIAAPEVVSSYAKDHNATMVLLLELFSQKKIDPDAYARLSKEEQMHLMITSLGAEAFLDSEKHILFETIKKHAEALRIYQPKPYSGKALFFEGTEQFFRFGKNALSAGWHQLVHGGVEDHVITGNHFTMMNYPGITKLCKIISKHISF